ncbi:hypothetical protein QBC39DRAFT_34314 [Podospora conica]|nr:hypothetical protein QBC39DRAFT_34314 [Schizothecium conicum]
MSDTLVQPRPSPHFLRRNTCASTSIACEHKHAPDGRRSLLPFLARRPLSTRPQTGRRSFPALSRQRCHRLTMAVDVDVAIHPLDRLLARSVAPSAPGPDTSSRGTSWGQEWEDGAARLEIMAAQGYNAGLPQSTRAPLFGHQTFIPSPVSLDTCGPLSSTSSSDLSTYNSAAAALQLSRPAISQNHRHCDHHAVPPSPAYHSTAHRPPCRRIRVKPRAIERVHAFQPSVSHAVVVCSRCWASCPPRSPLSVTCVGDCVSA